MRHSYFKTAAHAMCVLAMLWGYAYGADRIRADKLVIQKSVRTLTLFNRGTPIASYTISLGFEPQGHKLQEGDGRTPEGIYTIDRRNAASKFYKSLHVSYPNARDKDQARQRGVSPGGGIMIHGIKNGFGWLGALHRLVDWTKGCIAVTNGEMDEIWAAVEEGTPVEIKP